MTWLATSGSSDLWAAAHAGAAPVHNVRPSRAAPQLVRRQRRDVSEEAPPSVGEPVHEHQVHPARPARPIRPAPVRAGDAHAVDRRQGRRPTIMQDYLDCGGGIKKT